MKMRKGIAGIKKRYLKNTILILILKAKYGRVLQQKYTL
jgi:hypothetical protein